MHQVKIGRVGGYNGFESSCLGLGMVEFKSDLTHCHPWFRPAFGWTFENKFLWMLYSQVSFICRYVVAGWSTATLLYCRKRWLQLSKWYSCLSSWRVNSRSRSIYVWESPLEGWTTGTSWWCWRSIATILCSSRSRDSPVTQCRWFLAFVWWGWRCNLYR